MVKVKLNYTRSEGIALWIIYYIFFALGNFLTREEFIQMSAFFFTMGLVVWFFGKKKKEKRK